MSNSGSRLKQELRNPKNPTESWYQIWNQLDASRKHAQEQQCFFYANENAEKGIILNHTKTVKLPKTQKAIHWVAIEWKHQKILPSSRTRCAESAEEFDGGEDWEGKTCDKGQKR